VHASAKLSASVDYWPACEPQGFDASQATKLSSPHKRKRQKPKSLAPPSLTKSRSPAGYRIVGAAVNQLPTLAGYCIHRLFRRPTSGLVFDSILRRCRQPISSLRRSSVFRPCHRLYLRLRAGSSAKRDSKNAPPVHASANPPTCVD